MRAGRLDRLITIQRKAVTQTSSGAEVAAWSNLGTHRRRAGYRAVRGDERFRDDQWIANEQVEFTIRYSSEVSGLSPLDRIIYPAVASADSPPAEEPDNQTVYDIMAVHEIGRREGLRIMAARRSEVAPS